MKIQGMRPTLSQLGRDESVAVAEPVPEEPVAALSELEEPVWAVISFDRVEAGGLTHAEAVRLMSELDRAGIAGLCIVTEAVAERIQA
jgi:hypothetical protein